MLGIYELFKKGAANLPDDNYILQEADVKNISGAQEYAGKSWAEIKAIASQNPIIQVFTSIYEPLGNLASVIGGLIGASFASIIHYKNPIEAVKEDISTILKGGATLLTLSAILALGWKCVTIWATFSFLKKKFKK